jgi:hypothetical protein
MKHEYFGDQLDYVKYAILRELVRSTGCSLCVAWMLTPPGVKVQGKRRTYLNKPEDWRSIDPSLFDLLLRLSRAGDPSLDLVQSERILDATSFVSIPFLGTTAERPQYLELVQQASASADLVFFDPDVGIAPASTSVEESRAEHIHLNELVAFFARGRSIAVFQHYPRIKWPSFRRTVAKRVRDALGASDVHLVGSDSAFLVLAPNPSHASLSRSALLLERWSEGRGLLYERYGAPECAASGKSAPLRSPAQEVENDPAMASATWLSSFKTVLGDLMDASLDKWLANAERELQSRPTDSMRPEEIVRAFARRSSDLASPEHGATSAIDGIEQLSAALALQVQLVAAIADHYGHLPSLTSGEVRDLLVEATGYVQPGLVGLAAVSPAIASVIPRTDRVLPILRGTSLFLMSSLLHRLTIRIGQHAITRFSGEPRLNPDESDSLSRVEAELLRVGVEILVGLARADGNLGAREQEWLESVIAGLDLEDRVRGDLLALLRSPTPAAFSFDRYIELGGDGEALLFDLQTLASREDGILPAERTFLTSAAKALGSQTYVKAPVSDKPQTGADR